MVADTLVYHPSVAHYLRYVATTIGRDKLLRTLQYWSRFYAWYLYRTNYPERVFQPYEVVKKQLGLTRKIMRMGKFVEHYKAAAQLYDTKSEDPVLKYLGVGRQLGYAMYLTLDAMTVMDATGVKKWEGAKRLQAEAYRAWFFGLACNALAGTYALWTLRERERKLDRKEGEGVVELKKIEKQRSMTTTQLVSDVCDLTVPSSALGWANFDDGIVGLAGTLSSLIGVWSTWQKTA